MNLDLREPTIVIAGAFNPAIFEPGWVALELLGYDDGANVNATVVADMSTLTQKAYIDQIAIFAEPFRLSVFVDNFSDETIVKAEAAVIQSAKALPHTPVGGVGVNFKISVFQPEAAIIDALAPMDHPEKIGPVTQTETTSKLALEDNVRLNFSRAVVDDALILKFNYHRDLERFGDINGWMNGKIKVWQAHALSIAENLYGLSEPLEFTRTLNN